MRDMANIYRYCTSENLRLNLSRKRRELQLLTANSMWKKRDMRELQYHIRQIEVELAARAAQPKLPL